MLEPLYSLIRHYQAERTQQLGRRILSFRLGDLEGFAAQFPSRYPEYVVDPERIESDVRFAREAAEIQPDLSGRRDDVLWLSWDYRSPGAPPQEAYGG